MLVIDEKTDDDDDAGNKSEFNILYIGKMNREVDIIGMDAQSYQTLNKKEINCKKTKKQKNKIEKKR